ncbi:hypothetical protein OG871_32355 [Kitasatospora sp. NBC_00374]|uniref:hypothetical protein n=1 Tax=Kitasatospora sp. NBC_00374 TaxID=2975964 RepID=UPI0032486970
MRASTKRTATTRTATECTATTTRWAAVALLAAGLLLGTATTASADQVDLTHLTVDTPRTTATNAIEPTWNSTGS